jgi:hypothetical protein
MSVATVLEYEASHLFTEQLCVPLRNGRRQLHINWRWLPRTTLFVTEKTMTSKDIKRLQDEEEAEESTASTNKQRTIGDDNDDSSSTEDFLTESKKVSSEEEMNL